MVLADLFHDIHLHGQKFLMQNKYSKESLMIPVKLKNGCGFWGKTGVKNCQKMQKISFWTISAFSLT